MAETDRPWRCRSRIMTSSPSVITAVPSRFGNTMGDQSAARRLGTCPTTAPARQTWGLLNRHFWGELLRHQELHISRREVTQALVVALVVVVLHEGTDLDLQVSR